VWVCVSPRGKEIERIRLRFEGEGGMMRLRLSVEKAVPMMVARDD
jgi:hypothetical protein